MYLLLVGRQGLGFDLILGVQLLTVGIIYRGWSACEEASTGCKQLLFRSQWSITLVRGADLCYAGRC